MPTLSQLRDQIPPQPEGEHENQIEITETVPEEVVLRLTPEMARTLMATLAELESAKQAEDAEANGDNDGDSAENNGGADDATDADTDGANQQNGETEDSAAPGVLTSSRSLTDLHKIPFHSDGPDKPAHIFAHINGRILLP